MGDFKQLGAPQFSPAGLVICYNSAESTPEYLTFRVGVEVKT